MSKRKKPAAKRSVSGVVQRYRKRLIDDSHAFTIASLALAQSSVAGDVPFNEATTESRAALVALATWQGDAQSALASIQGVASTAVGQKLAVQWLNALNAALGLINQSLALTDPTLAAEAAGRARQSFDEAHRLQDSLDRAIA